MTTDEGEDKQLVFNFSRWPVVLRLIAELGAVGALLWGGASYAIDNRAGKAVTDKLNSAHVSTTSDLQNIYNLLSARMDSLEKRQIEGNDRLEYLYRHELERNGGNK